MKPAPPSTQKRRSRLFLSLFFVGLIAACALLTVGVTSRLNETREKLSDWTPGHKCIGILRGDLIEVTDYETTNRVQLLGIDCPPVRRDAVTDAVAAKWLVPTDELVQHGIVARDTLTAWIYKRQVQFEFPSPEGVEVLDDGTWLAYGSVAGVDIARKMLKGGQARSRPIDHPRRAEYERYEAEAKADGVGLWRTPGPTSSGRQVAAVVMILTPLLLLAVLVGRSRRRATT